MTPECYARLRQHFENLDVLSDQDRDRYLRDLRGVDAEEGELLESFLLWDQRAESFLATGGAPVSPENDPLPPPELRNYHSLVELGHGGMGAVYRAQQVDPPREVAVKVMTGVVWTPRAVERFQQEARVLGQLEHPGIARIFEASTKSDGSTTPPYIAMEFVDGDTLDNYLRRVQPDVRTTLSLIVQICEAVQHAHDNGVIHRDLKPSNILVNSSGAPKIVDFGVAQAVGTGRVEDKLTEPGQIIGTLAYMSPEQANGVARIDVRSDVYSLGVILFEALSGHLPLPLRGESRGEILAEIANRTPESLSRWKKELRGDLEAIVGNCLEKAPFDRYASVSALASDLTAYLNNEPISVRPITHYRRLLLFSRRHTALATTIGIASAVVLSLLPILAFLYLRSERSKQEVVATLSSAALAFGERAQWDQALEYSGAALLEGPSDSSLRLLRARVFLVRNELQRCSEELAVLDTDLSATDTARRNLLQGEVHLLQGDSVLGRELVRRALKHLDPTELCYARALLAETSEERIAQLDRTMGRSATHYRARERRAALWCVSKPVEVAAEEIRVLARYNPGDPSHDAMRAVLAARTGDLTSAIDLFDSEPHLRGARLALKQFTGVIARAVQSYPISVDQRQPVTRRILNELTDCQQALAHPDTSVHFPLPESFFQGWRLALQAADIANQDPPGRDVTAQVERLLGKACRVHRDGLLLYLHAVSKLPDKAKSLELMHSVAKAPALLPTMADRARPYYMALLFAVDREGNKVSWLQEFDQFISAEHFTPFATNQVISMAWQYGEQERLFSLIARTDELELPLDPDPTQTQMTFKLTDARGAIDAGWLRRAGNRVDEILALDTRGTVNPGTVVEARLIGRKVREALKDENFVTLGSTPDLFDVMLALAHEFETTTDIFASAQDSSKVQGLKGLLGGTIDAWISQQHVTPEQTREAGPVEVVSLPLLRDADSESLVHIHMLAKSLQNVRTKRLALFCLESFPRTAEALGLGSLTEAQVSSARGRLDHLLRP